MANQKILAKKQEVIDEIKDNVNNSATFVLFDYDLNIDVKEALEGPSAFAYSTDQIAPIKVLSDFAKDHENLTLKIGYVDGEVADQAKLTEYAKIPSRDGLLTMLAGGMIGLVRDLSICLNLYSEQKEEN